jgi:hypothetical protein
LWGEIRTCWRVLYTYDTPKNGPPEICSITKIIFHYYISVNPVAIIRMYYSNKNTINIS